MKMVIVIDIPLVKEESKDKVYSNGNRAKRVRCIETGKIYPSIAQASRETGLGNISKCCLGVHKTCGGKHWEFVD